MKRGRKPAPLHYRFFGKISLEENGCWNWLPPKNWYGYGVFSIRKFKDMKAHRWSYEYFKGPIPDGLQIDHICRNRACVNPDHLEAVTSKENLRRGIAYRPKRYKTKVSVNNRKECIA